MYRTIKFKGKSKAKEDDGRYKWIYGNLVVNAQEKGAKYYIDDHGHIYEVFEDTIGQFTGLYDKDGDEIYEGDLLTLTIPDGSNRIFKVVWGQEKREYKALDGFDDSNTWPVEVNGWCFEWEREYNKYHLLPSVIDGVPDYKKMKIIGNAGDSQGWYHKRYEEQVAKEHDELMKLIGDGK